MRNVLRVIISALILATTLLVGVPASATPALTTCNGASSAKIALVYSYGVPYANKYLRCGTTGFGYNHIKSRWIADPNFSAYIRSTMQYGNTTQQGTATVFQCYSVVVNCRGVSFRVVYENSNYADGYDKGIITAYRN